MQMRLPVFKRVHSACRVWALLATLAALSPVVFWGQQQFSAGAPPNSEDRKNLKRIIRRIESGDTSKTLAELEQLIEQFRAKGELGHEAEAQRAVGDAYANQGDVFASLAADRYQKSVDLFRKAAVPGATKGLNASAAMAFNAQLTLAKLGDLHRKLGQVEQAERYYGQIAPDKPKIDVFEAQYSAQQRVRKTTSTKSQTQGTARRLGGLLGRKPSLSTLGQASSEVESTKSVAAEAVGTATGVVEDLHRANLLLKGYILSDISLGRTAVLRGSEAAARERFESALSFATRYPPVFGKSSAARRFQIVALTDLGDLAFQQKRYADAAKHYEAARVRAKDARRLDLSWPAAYGLGRTLRALAESEAGASTGKLNASRDRARGAYREAVAVIEELRGRSLRGDEARQSFAAQTADVYSEFAEVLATWAVQASGDVRRPLEGEALQLASEAFVTSEQARARALLDLMAETGTEVSEGFQPELIEKRRELYSRQSQLSDQLIGIVPSERGTENQDDELLEVQIDQLGQEAARLEAELRAANPRYASFTAPVPLTLSKVQTQLLDPNTVLVTYTVAENRCHLWVISQEGVWLHPVDGLASLTPMVEKLRAQMLAPPLARGAAAKTAPVITPVTPQPAKRSVSPEKTSGPPAARKAAGTAPGPASSRKGTRDLKPVATSQPSVRPLKEDPAAREYASVAGRLYESLLGPARAAIRGKRLWIVGDDVLNTIPFEALVTEQPAEAGVAPADFASLKYLVRDHEIAYAPSATVMEAIRQQRAGKPAGEGALLMGDPIFDPADARLKPGSTAPEGEAAVRDLVAKTFLAASSSSVAETSDTEKSAADPAHAATIPRLPATRRETTRIAEILKQAGTQADVLLDLQANEAELRKRNLQPYRFLHLATHGLLNADRPQFSGMVLSLVGNPEGVDGFLRTQEVFDLRLGSPLVILSACKTGLGRHRKGEGLVGLTRAFHYAGAPTVGVSLWPVDDDSTAALMTLFYRQLLPAKTAGGKAPPGLAELTGALRSAQLQLIEERLYSAPFFWAPFVLVGDYRLRS
jgi:CHAT domain-containing protein/tetratricopeptide (TPR) repeat protein